MTATSRPFGCSFRRLLKGVDVEAYAAFDDGAAALPAAAKDESNL